MRVIKFVVFYLLIFGIGYLAWNDSVPYFFDRFSAPQKQPEVVSDEPPVKEDLTNEIFSDGEMARRRGKELIVDNQIEAYRRLREEWVNRENNPDAWFFLDVDAYIKEDNMQGAIDLLNSRRYTGSQETHRLIRLAALHVVTDPAQSWGYLTEASLKDSTNTDLHIYKASLLETMSKPENAQTEYLMAIQKDLENLHLREQLVDFYLRTGEYNKALQILDDSLSPPSLDSLWLKAIFWGRMVGPIENINVKEMPAGSLQPFVAYLLALPPNVYWNEKAFARVSGNDHYLQSQQAAFWLRLMAALKNGEEAEAWKILKKNPFQPISWAPELERSLFVILSYRMNPPNVDNQEMRGASSEFSSMNSQDFLNALSRLADLPVDEIPFKVPAGFRDYLLGPEAYVMPFLAYGWNEAALQLHSMSIIPDTFPSWMPFMLTQALQWNRGQMMAYEFALDQTNQSPELHLLTAELALKERDIPMAIHSLQKVALQKGPVGNDASIHLATLLLEQGNLVLAKKTILLKPELSSNVTAQEILARIALQEGDEELAYHLYLGLESQSAEAKSYLAQKAFRERNWARARQLTEQLASIYPNNSKLKENLKKIIAEQKKQGLR